MFIHFVLFFLNSLKYASNSTKENLNKHLNIFYRYLIIFLLYLKKQEYLVDFQHYP